jgi:hypothetical protein
MPESRSHKTAKRQAAGKRGKTEVSTPYGRLDARTPRKAVEVERSGNPKRLEHALEKLKNTRGVKRVLRVPAGDQELAKQVAEKVSLTVTITNLKGGNPTRVKP